MSEFTEWLEAWMAKHVPLICIATLLMHIGLALWLVTSGCAVEI